jgi:dihydrolipoamide dehydrogenase
MSETYDLIVVGGGPAGYVGAIRAAQLGKKVALIEKERPGGTCLHWGCIPTKSLLKSAELYQQIQNSELFGIKTTGVEFDFTKIVQRSRNIADRLTKGIESLFKKHKIDHLKGIGTVIQSGKVSFRSEAGDSRVLETSHILIATGAKPRLIPQLPIDGVRILTSREAMILGKPPKSLIIIGAGAIGVEFAYFFHSFGVEVTLIEMLPQILPYEDEEIARELEKQFVRKGIRVFTNTKLEQTQVSETGVKMSFTGKESMTLEAEQVLLAIGLEANLEGALSPELKIDRERGYLKTDSRYQSSVPGIFGAGDVIGPPWLAHVASYEAIQAVEGMFTDHTPQKVNIFPSCIYCQPQVASVGLTEKRAREKELSYKVGKFPFFSLGKALAAGDNSGFVKLLFSEPGGEILGAHIIGAEATELISEVNLGMTMKATRDHIIGTIHAHPTLSEALGEAAAASAGEAIHA